MRFEVIVNVAAENVNFTPGLRERYYSPGRGRSARSWERHQESGALLQMIAIHPFGLTDRIADCQLLDVQRPRFRQVFLVGARPSLLHFGIGFAVGT